MEESIFTVLLRFKDTDLRPYQNDNKEQIYEYWKDNRAVMLQMPTGTGKTRLFVSILKDFHKYAAELRKQIRVLVLVHRVELIDQISEELGVRYGLAHGFIHSKDRERRKFPFQIASVQTLNRRIQNWADYGFDFIIVDEAHHVLAESYRKIINTFPNAKILGVTATPCRLSGVGFRPEFDKLIVSDSIQEFINKGYLCNYEYYSISPYSYVQNQIERIQATDASGEFATAEMQKICAQDKIRAQIVETYLNYAKGKKGIVYTINKIHNKHLCEAFCEKGIKAVAIDSDTDVEERERMIEEFKLGKIDILCNVDIFSEGFDCPDIEFVQLARPTKSLSLYLQQVGRGLRISANKEKTIFLDNVGLYNRFGVPAANRYWEDYFEGVEGATESRSKSKDSKDAKERICRERDLSEGNEKVHLIHDSLDDDYAYERAKVVSLTYFGILAFYIFNSFDRERYLEDYECKLGDGCLKMMVEKVLFDQWNIPKIMFLSKELADETINMVINRECDFFRNLKIEVLDDTYFNQYVKSAEIDTIEKYIESIKYDYDRYLLSKFRKEFFKNFRKYHQEIKRQKIGKNERLFLFDLYRFVSQYFSEKDVEHKELFNLKRYVDEIERMGNMESIDKVKLARFNELVEEGEKRKNKNKSNV